jgi:hypothetical protein
VVGHVGRGGDELVAGPGAVDRRETFGGMSWVRWSGSGTGVRIARDGRNRALDLEGGGRLGGLRFDLERGLWLIGCG